MPDMRHRGARPQSKGAAARSAPVLQHTRPACCSTLRSLVRFVSPLPEVRAPLGLIVGVPSRGSRASPFPPGGGGNVPEPPCRPSRPPLRDTSLGALRSWVGVRPIPLDTPTGLVRVQCSAVQRPLDCAAGIRPTPAPWGARPCTVLRTAQPATGHSRCRAAKRSAAQRPLDCAAGIRPEPTPSGSPPRTFLRPAPLTAC